MTSRQDRYAPPGTPPTDDDLEHEVELTRRELGDTVAELMYRADVKSRAREAAQHRLAAAQARGRALLTAVRANPVPAAVAAAALALVTVLLLLLRIRR